MCIRDSYYSKSKELSQSFIRRAEAIHCSAIVVTLDTTLLGWRLPLPIDDKSYDSGGRATHVQVHLGRGGRHRWILHDRNWRPLVDATDRPAAPESLPAMLAAAETLSRGMSFLRVDLYEVDGHPYFGEFCLYPGSGFDPFAADWIDHELGALWLDAMPS